MHRPSMLISLLSILFLAVIGSNTTHASSFNAGKIIDDVVFTNSTSMTVEQTQVFLNSKVPNCDTNGTQPASEFGRPDLTHAQYAASRGWQAPPYTCLRNYNEGGKSGAQIIYDAAQQYSINPQALIVTLQKESSLVTDTWPLDTQYRTAMGYGCPDSGPNNTANCSSQYYGFANQVKWAATLYRSVINKSPTWYSPYVVGNNYIQWNPNANCGGSTVYIQNLSTAALYDYTPYQPNQASLNAGWGPSSDPCSAYGNRNFWLYFNDWFGSTEAPNYSWAFVGQYAFTDTSKSIPVNMSTLMPGQRVYVGFQARNTGNRTWSNTGSNPVRVGTVRDYNRTSAFYDSSWLGYGRPASLKEASVAPGEVGSFEFWMTAPPVSQATNYNEYFAPLAEGAAWMQDIGMNFGVRVTPPTYSWSLVGQAAYTDATKSVPTGLENMKPGERKFVSMIIKNTGNVAWSSTGANPLDLGSTRPTDRSSPFYDSTWLGYNRPARMKEASVTPGQNATLEFWIKAPSTSQSTIFREYFTPVVEGITWMQDIGLNYYINVEAATYSWSLVGQAAYTDATKSVPTGLENMKPGERKFVSMIIKNTGNVAWSSTGANPLDLGSTRPTDRSSPFYDSTWLGYNRPARMKEASVTPGQNATLEFWIKAPSTSQSTIFREYFTPVVEGITWMQDIGLNYYINVKP